MSMKLTPAAAASTTTWPGPGSRVGVLGVHHDLGARQHGDDYRPHRITSFRLLSPCTPYHACRQPATAAHRTGRAAEPGAGRESGPGGR